MLSARGESGPTSKRVLVLGFSITHRWNHGLLSSQNQRCGLNVITLTHEKENAVGENICIIQKNVIPGVAAQLLGFIPK